MTTTRDNALDLIAYVRTEERELGGRIINDAMTPEGHLAMVGAAISDASEAFIAMRGCPSGTTREQAKRALARVAAAAAEGIQAIEREEG